MFQVGLVDPFSGGVIQVSAFQEQAMYACDYPNTDQPFICLDLTYIYVLLRDGFGLEPTTRLYVSIYAIYCFLRFNINSQSTVLIPPKNLENGSPFIKVTRNSLGFLDISFLNSYAQGNGKKNFRWF